MLDRVGIRRLVVEIKKFVQKVCEDAMDSGGFKTYHYSAIRKYLDALVVRKAMKRYGLYQFYNSFVDREVKSSLTIFIYPTDDVKYIEINFEMNRTESVV
jgi:hypothetical protein